MTSIVVGVDGSSSSGHALAWAVGEAKRRGAQLRVVTTWAYPALAAALPVPSPTLDEFREAAVAAQARSLAAVDVGDVPVVQRIVQGNAAATLAAEPAPGDLLVVGRRGIGGFDRLLLGSTSRGVLRRTHVPTFVVPPPDDAARADAVVVGLDNTETDRAVLDTAVEEARVHGGVCIALHACDLGIAATSLGAGEAAKAWMDAAQEALDEQIKVLSADDVEFRPEVVVAPAGAALIDASKHAALLVVGRRSHGFLGSVADACAAHASCPVLVVPGG